MKLKGISFLRFFNNADQHPLRRFLTASICAAGVLFFICLLHRLAAQALSQGYVLEELGPVMGHLIGAGAKLHHREDLPRLAAALLAFIFLLISSFSSVLSRKSGAKKTSNRWLFVVAASFLLMALAAKGNFIFCIFAALFVVFLGWLGQTRRSDTGKTLSLERSPKLTVLGIVLLALLIRLYQLDVFPARYTVDEQLFARAALELGEDPTGFFSQPHYIKPHLVKILAIRAVFSALGTGLFQHRLVSVIEGTLCVLLVFFLVRRLWGNAAGVFAASLVAVDPWHIGYSKFGVHEIEGPLFLIALLLLLIHALEKGGKLNFALLGVISGLSAYLYQSDIIMAPFAFAAAVGFGLFSREVPKTKLAEELLAMSLAFLLVLLPHLTFGRANVRELFSIYSGSSNFVVASNYYGVTPVQMLFSNISNAIETVLQLRTDGIHPAKVFRPDALTSGFVLLGLGVLISRIKNSKNLLFILWIPIAFVPAAIGFGFEERRLFATLAPVPMMLAGLALAHVWERDDSHHSLGATAASRAFVLMLLVLTSLSSLYITFSDTDSSLGRPAQPRKAAEFVASLPPSNWVIIANRIRDYPFILRLLTYDKTHRQGLPQNYCFAEFAEIEARAQEFASKSHFVLLLDPGVKEARVLQQLGELNPNVSVLKKLDFWACMIGTRSLPEPDNLLENGAESNLQTSISSYSHVSFP